MAAQQLIIIVLFLYPIKSNISGALNNISHIFDRRACYTMPNFRLIFSHYCVELSIAVWVSTPCGTATLLFNLPWTSSIGSDADAVPVCCGARELIQKATHSLSSTSGYYTHIWFLALVAAPFDLDPTKWEMTRKQICLSVCNMLFPGIKRQVNAWPLALLKSSYQWAGRS